jgi:hypothetical protein
MFNAVKNYWKPYFEGRLLGELTRQDVNAFIDSLGKRAQVIHALECDTPLW